MNTQTLSFCEGMLMHSKSVAEWNMQMASLVNVGMTVQMRAYIESTGLIVKVLGVDKGQPHISN